MPSHTGDGAAEAIWPQFVVDGCHAGDNAAKSCWQRRYRGDLAVA
jgi:hypothetical protein